MTTRKFTEAELRNFASRVYGTRESKLPVADLAAEVLRLRRALKRLRTRIANYTVQMKRCAQPTALHEDFMLDIDKALAGKARHGK